MQYFSKVKTTVGNWWRIRLCVCVCIRDVHDEMTSQLNFATLANFANQH